MAQYFGLSVFLNFFSPYAVTLGVRYIDLVIILVFHCNFTRFSGEHILSAKFPILKPYFF
jgi:hypothetical protein